ATTSESRPNILWLVSEDNSRFTIGAYGDPLARTPHLDRLAAGGIVFENAYAAAPVCAPSRASIITGMYATALGTQPMRSQIVRPPALHESIHHRFRRSRSVPPLHAFRLCHNV